MRSIALVGRTNVGKSTLFNRLTRSRKALVANFPGLTRDRRYGIARVGETEFVIIDTGGISGAEEGLDALVRHQTKAAIDEADLLFLLVDGRTGLTAGDELLAEQLRLTGKPLVLVVNKSDGEDPDALKGDFFTLGLAEMHLISAVHGRGIAALMNSLVHAGGEQESAEPAASTAENPGIRVALVGRPNVGKSTLINRLLGEERVVVSDQPGTTRDSVYVPFVRDGHQYVLIDTAGVRRRGRVRQTVEKFSIVKTLDAIQDCNVAVLLVDSSEGLVEQDLHLLSLIIEAGRGLVLACNKWDGLATGQKQKLQNSLSRRLRFINYLKVHFISALHGSGVGNLYGAINQAWDSASISLRTQHLNQMLQQLVHEHPPPLVRGRRVKLRYAHQGGSNPPRIVVHGNQTKEIPDQYRRYLAHGFSRLLKLEGTPLAIEFRTGENPFAGRKNQLTARQVSRRRRMIRHTRKKERKKQH